MTDTMIDTLGHHLIPLLSLPGAAGALGGKAHLIAVKEACKSAKRIHGALGIALRFEVAVVPDVPDFFDPSPVMAKARNLVWEIIRTTPRLQWVIPTRYPELISASLPSTWIGKGFQNVCIGLVADAGDDFPEKLQALRNVSLQHRLILMFPSALGIELSGQLGGIDWVVFAGNPNDSSQVAAIQTTCREADVAFLFHQPDAGATSRRANSPSDDPTPWPIHPFGNKIDLFRPTLSDLKQVPLSRPEERNTHSSAVIKSESSAPAVMKTDDMRLDAPQKSPAPATAPPTQIMDIDVPTPDLGKPEIDPSGMSPPGISDVDLDDFSHLDSVVRRGLATFIEVGRALAEIRSRELWRAGGHSSWAAYCEVTGGITKTHANRLINSSEIAIHLTQVAPIGVTPTAESQVRPLSKLKEPEQQVLAWSRAAERAMGQPTAKMLSEVVAELMEAPTKETPQKQSSRELVAGIIVDLRAAVSAKRPSKEIDGIITDLEKLLGLGC